jgi:glyoxylase-like metal-dependent hydrolase (beta-lactamase superfamily II)
MAVQIPFVRDIKFEYGAPQEVSPLIRRVVAHNPSPFTYLGTGVYIIGRGEVAVIDPGPDQPGHLDVLLSAIGGEKVTHILVTHGHMDHSPMAGPLSRATGAPIFAAGGVMQAADHGVEVEAGDDDAFAPDNIVEDGQFFAGPGWTLEAVFTPGHTSNHMCYALREENALFSGDHIMGWSTTVITPPDGDMGAYYASLNKVLDRNYDVLWPTHGPPVRAVRPFIEAYIAHRHDREAQILERLAAGQRHIADMVPIMYAAVDKRLYPAASHSVLAHLIHMVRAGRVACAGAPSLQSAYSLPG